MVIDIRTLFIFSIPLFGCFSLTAFYLWRSHKDIFKGIGYWSVAFALQSIAGILFALRHELHDILSIIVANSLLTLGYVLFFDGISLFAGKRSRKHLNYIALAVVVVLFVYYGLININLSARILIITLALAFILFHTSYLAFSSRHGDERETYLLNSILFSGIGFIYLLRFPITLFVDPGSDFMRSGIYQSLNVLVYVFGGALIAIGLILLVNSRLSSIQQRSKFSLAESEERFKQLADATFEGIVIHDMGKVLDCNELILSMIQLTREEVMGMDVIKFVSPEDQPRVQKYIAEGSKDPYEIVCIRKDGTTFHAEIHAKTAPYKGTSVRVVAVRDITERMQYETDLKFFKDSLDKVDEQVFLVREDARIDYVNATACKVLGYTEDELLGLRVTDIAPGEQTGNWPKHWAELEKSKQMRFESAQKTKEGQVFPTEVVANLIEHEGKKYNLAFVHDISERKKAEEALRESEKKFKAIANYTANRETWYSPEGELLWMSPSVIEQSGYSEQEILDMPDFPISIVHPDHRAFVQEKFIEAISKGKSDSSFEVKMLNKDGSSSWMLVSSQPIYLDGEYAGIRMSGHDINEQKEAEDRLKESEERFRTAFEYNPDIATITKIDDGTLVSVNDAFVKFTGTSREEAIGRSTHDFGFWSSSEDREEFTDILQKEGSVDNFEIQLKMKSGADFHGLLTSKIVTMKEEPRILTFIKDITQRKLMEEQIKSSLKEKELLLKEIHHRVKNNMQVVSSLLNLQARQVDDEFVHEMFEKSQSRIRSMSLVHEQLYQSEDFAHIDFQGYLEKLVSNVTDTYVGDASQIAVTVDAQDLDLSIDSSIPCGLIVTELVSNAYKYAFPSGRHGTISIKADKDADDMINLRIEDNGTGIPKNVDLKKTKSLGMRLVYMLAEHQLSGKVKIDRKKGTRFHIRFKDSGLVEGA